eukprot:COSAG01_NODE_413_length_17368_cov_15.823672_10_plen_347_part_00
MLQLFGLGPALRLISRRQHRGPQSLHLRPGHIQPWRLLHNIHTGRVCSVASFPLRRVHQLPSAHVLTAAKYLQRSTHYEIAMAAVERGLHVMVTKPAVKTLTHHLSLIDAAKKKGVFVMVEVHKRFDPIYVRMQCRCGDSLFVCRTLHPPLRTASHTEWSVWRANYSTRVAADRRSRPHPEAWWMLILSGVHVPAQAPARDICRMGGQVLREYASLSAPLVLMLILTAQDISYYLNSHHVDFHEWCLLGKARPTTVTAIASTGVAKSKGIDTEDTITLTVQWKNLADGTLASAVLPPNAYPYTKISTQCPCARRLAALYLVVDRPQGRRSQSTTFFLHGTYGRGDR